ncbi:hypothetical protein AaE_015489 [Aphanomyces astaci]|uniref:Integrase catalytic domain-containing protein n=1 Tax=Aphanomyces astaci TaxID=112090 RepID=A0A6A4Z1P4_APHAT|nr:hypothetical protein AaE_015489 [Aphanomyces astaci]
MGLGTPKQLPELKVKCECCAKNKITKISPPKERTRSFRPGECWVSDTKGPMRTESVGGCKYYTVYLDVGSGMKVVRFVKSTDAATQHENFNKLKSWSEVQTGRKIKIFRSDGGSEYSSNDFNDALKTWGITHEKSTADNQWQNGMAERAHRSIMEMAMAMMSHAGLAKRWWAEAVNTAVFIQNRVPHGPAATTTPIEAFSGHRARLDKLRVFGCIAYNMIKEPEKRDKLSPKATKCVMMGYAEAQKAYKLYDLEHQKMVTSVQVEFRENEFPGVRTPINEYLVTHDDDDDDDEELTQGEPVATKPTSTPVTTSQPRMAPPSHFKPGKRVTSTPIPRGMSTQAHFYPDSIVDGAVGGRPLSALTPPATSRRDTMMTMDEFNSPPSDYRGMALRDRNKIRVPARFDGESARRSNTKQVANVIRDLDAATGRDRANAATEVELGATMTVDGVEYACSALPTMDDIPQSHHEAMRSPDRAEWAKAEELELKQLRDAGTWKLVDLPTGRKSIGSRWTYAKKTNSAGEVIRHKARLVCKGYSQVEGVDYTDTYSPVVKMGTIRACAAFVVSKNYVIVQADADTAFVQAKMDEGVLLYVDQPPGHGDGTNRVMLLIKALYGLKQAALAWFEHCRKILLSISFHPSAYDPCLYLRESEGSLEMLSTYVDDFLVMTKTTAAAEKILDQLERKRKLKRQGKAAYFLGMKIDYQGKSSL